MTSRVAITVLLTTSLLASGCGANVAPSSNGESGTVTIDNCGRTIEYPEPERPVAYDMSSTEKMFALGLADRMRGIVMPSTADPSVKRSPWREDYRSVETLSTDVLSLEVVLDAKADWVLAGWESGFSQARGITPSKLDSLGIQSYQHTESCFNYGSDPVRVPPLEALYTDLRQIGKIFHIEDRAKRVVTDLKQRARELREQRPQGTPPRVFIYDSGTDKPFTSGAQAAPNAIVSLAGGRNITHDLDKRWTTIGWESVVQANPEVITVVDYGDKPVEDKIAFLKSFPPLAQTPAIKNDRFHVIDYGAAVSGPRNIAAAEKFADHLRSIGR
ncbi:iron complex transport system substrate-binding protein [Actinopolyspora alba]|uniref:Iron complex transport system substrate-binding protein n=1 Tax=Actinopolyspora alba TaxID=673379 RepID=A0A1I1ZK69_9ACTN|nr:ABC transporter substrate-binding protein [Actinopolyspora alba]SFE32224.1 iron complex transport system substrate-binding protein [Actinopolyspora alba]